MGAPSAEAATTTRLWTNTNRATLATDLALAAFSAGSPTVIVSQDTATATHVAGVVGARANAAVIVSTSGTSTASVLNTLKTLKATKVVLVASTQSHFSTAFKSELTAATISVTSTVEAADAFGLWVKAAAVSGTASEYVIARTDNAQAVAIATSSAMTRGVPLVLWEDGTSATALASFFSSIGTANITAVGDPLNTPTDQMQTAQIDTLRAFDTADPRKAFTWVASDAQAAGRIVNKVVTAPVNSLDALALAGGIARRGASVLVPAGITTALTTDSRASEYLQLWKNRAANVTLVGFGLTAANLTSLAQPTTTTDASAPAFRVVDLVKGTTGYTLSLTAVQGATVYKAYDLDGTVLATSSTTNLTTVESPSAALVTAETASGELARVNVRVNEYNTTDQRSSVVIGASGNGTNTVRVLSTLKTPRLVTRIVKDPYDPTVAPSAEVPVSITCANTFVETGMDSTKEYEYAVTELTNVDATTCDTTLAQKVAVAGSFFTSQLSLPATTEPASMMANARTASVSATATAPAPAPKKAPMTVADRMIQANIDAQLKGDAQAKSKGSSTQAVGDDYPPFLFRWVAYIPERYVPFPGPSGDNNYPFLAFHGDGHGSDPNGSARYRQDLTFYFGSQHRVSYTERMGESFRYKCNKSFKTCLETARATASGDELNSTGYASTNTSGTARITASATLPLLKNIAQPIDSDIIVRLIPGKSSFFGYHDLMPRHEAYVGVPNSEWWQVYKSPYNNFSQLPCLFSKPTAIIRGCGAAVNVGL